MQLKTIKHRYRKPNKEHPFLYLAPTIIVLCLLVLIPFINNLIKSFTMNGAFPVLGQYKKLFNDNQFKKDLLNTFKWMLLTVPGEMVFGLAIAIVLNMKIKAQKTFRTIFIVPWVIPSIVVCIIWKWIYNVDYGILNYLLKSFGLIKENQLWVSSVTQALPSVAAVYIWKMVPFVMIMYLSGLQAISSDIYEAAKIDGAKWYTQVFKITLPLLFPVIRSILLISMVWSMNSFVYVYSISGGGPARSSEIAQIFIYKTGIEQFNFEYSATAANIVLLIVMVIALIYNTTTERKEANLF